MGELARSAHPLVMAELRIGIDFTAALLNGGLSVSYRGENGALYVTMVQSR